MLKTKNTRAFISLVAVSIFIFSMAFASTTATLPESTEIVTPLDYSIFEDEWRAEPAEGVQGTNVWWEQDAGSMTDEWTWENKNWLFGPSPSFEIYHENGTLITGDHYATVGEVLNIAVTIPRGVLEGADIGQVNLNGWFMTADWNYSANFYVSFDAEYDYWSAYASEFNNSLAEPYIDNNFIHIDEVLSSNSSDINAYYVNFRVWFDGNAPLGLYQLDLGIMDTDWNWIGSYNFGSNFETQGISVGMPRSEAFSMSYDSSYTLEKLDLDGDTIYSLSRNKDFIMRFNITGTDPEWIGLGLPVPNYMDTLVNVTGWHSELVTDTGGWIYNVTLGTYVWDESLTVTYMREVYGTFEAMDYIETGLLDQLYDYQLWWDWDEETQTSTPVVVNESVYVDSQLMYIYNFTSLSWESYFFYEYWHYPLDHYVEGIWDERVQVWEPISSDIPIFYELNETECTVEQINGELVVSFVGHFTDAIQPSTEWSYYEFRDVVMGPDDWYYYPATWGDSARQTESEYQMARRITIESPVTIAKILNSDGTEAPGWMYQVDKEEDFLVSATLQGGAGIAEDIDGLRFSMEAYDGFWTEEESRWSQLIYEIEYDMDGSSSLYAFNRTEKQNQTFGLYWDWQPVTVTGWNNYYNESTNTWEMVYGEYEDWQSVEVEGWHWTWWTFNQHTGEWQNEWISDRSIEAAIAPDFAVTSDFTNWTEDGDLFVEFTVNMNSNVPDTNYYWDFKFMNNTWFEDYSSEYGLHEVESWDREWIYSFDYYGDKMYLDPFDYELAFNNETLSPGFDNYMLGLESPYIVIDGENLPITQIENFDPWNGYTWTTILLEKYDYEANEWVYYYELENGTEIELDYYNIYTIYNVTTPGGDSFLTQMQYDWYWNYEGTPYYFWIDIYGGIHQGAWEEYGSPYVTIEQYDMIQAEDEYSYEDEVWLFKYGFDSSLIIVDWRYSSMDQMDFLTDADGLLYKMRYISGVGYEIEVGGTWYGNVLWEYMIQEEYNSSDVYFLRWQSSQYWFYENEGVEYEMPYPGANAFDRWQMDNTDNNGGVIPTTLSLVYDGDVYPVYNVTEWDHYVDIYNETSMLVESYYVEKYDSVFHTSANGTDIWNPYYAGRIADFGYLDEDLQFNNVETLEYEMYWNGEMDVVELQNGTVWNTTETRVFTIFEYNVDGKSFYSAETYTYYFDDCNGTYFYYMEALNGSVIKLDDWRTPPIVSKTIISAYINSTGWWVYDFGPDTFMYTGCNDIWAKQITNATYSGDLYLFNENEIYNITYLGSEYTAYPAEENIYKMRNRWGHELKYGLTPINSQTYKNYWDIVIGIPEWGMWGVQAWTTNPENGALDLDGNLETEDDQYFVREEYTSTDSWNHTWDFMSVEVEWNPNATASGDEMNIRSWLGLDTFTWSYQWSQTYYWYYAETFEPLSTAEMNDVKDLLLSPEGEPRPGYWDISWMTQNVTWADILAQAEENGWDWISTEEQTWTWLSFGIDQNYGTSYETDEAQHWMDVGIHYEYSGLMIWEDLNDNSQMDVDLISPGSGELSHFLVPDSVDSLSFVTPGLAYADPSSSGELALGLEDEVTWGVNFYGVNGTVFPFTLQGYWGWYDGVMTGSDMRTFDERPTSISIDELSFLVHFQGYINETAGALNNYAEIKVDNYVGNWDVSMIGGRDNLENKSLALNYLADVRISDFGFYADGWDVEPEETVSAESFELESAGARFAEMIMGGVTYDWGKNTTAPYDVVSYTTPAGTFSQAFESQNGQSAVAWQFSNTMYYVTIGFPAWDGYSVFQDPVFVGYTSNQGATESVPPTGVTFGSLSYNPEVASSTDSVSITVDIDSQEAFDTPELYYSTDRVNWNVVEMTNTAGSTWTADVPPFPDNTEVTVKIVVHTDSGDYESTLGGYIVAVGVITTPIVTGPDATDPDATGPDGPPSGGELLPNDVLFLVAGGGIVGIIVVVLVMKRRGGGSPYSV
ncbi:MAG: hypothetical protein ACTSV2_14355 [Candidatus Thorarchaeota archaeon]